MEKIIAGHIVHVNEEGYLQNLDEWNEAIARELAETEGIALGDKHWEVITYLQNQFRNEDPITIRKVGKSGVTDIKEFYELFPNGPLKKASKIAGIPKPAGCI